MACSGSQKHIGNSPTQKNIAYARGVTTALLLYQTGSRSRADLNGMWWQPKA